MNDNQAPEAPAMRAMTGGASSGGGGMLGKVTMICVILAALLVGGAFAMRGVNTAMADMSIKGKEYQAVFLTNGQVYFGKVSKIDASYVKLTDIFYLQVQQQVQPDNSKSTDQQQPQVSLAKLGGELHGPEDVMYISRTQVLFWENLKSDGKVTKAISDYKAQGSK
ncbi:MAG TPA: hypothetical protein VLF67_01235 [Candidatus Saccharimonas sp.]|nr:hypothetical protein [Candidatus Saccharimonas sp.]